MAKTDAQEIAKLLEMERKIEADLLIKKNKNLAKNLRRLLSIKRKLVLLNYSKSHGDPQSHERE